jgi:proteasome component ECM29
MAAVPDENRELSLIDKVVFRILSDPNNEAKLTTLLDKYLAPLLLKAESPHASVRQKVGHFQRGSVQNTENI